ncbi:MAG TPA: S1 RNA-binding domain-containing protein [Anaerolineae bacterium]|nr:S1 RNA-binding domain-containing protein [Anaerolineae bacterium]
MSDSQLLSLNDIKPKMKFEGKIVKVELAGARVDIGAEQAAFLHISQLKADRPVTRVADILKAGDPITTWVKQVKPQQNLIALTMIEPLPLDWNDLQRRMKLTGKVVRVEDFGAFVSIGAPKDGLVPVSQMAKTRVNKPSDVVKEGDEVTVWVTSVNRKENRIGLSLVEPPAVDWSEIKRGQTVSGKVTRLEKFGAFVDIGAEREGMIHVSEIGAGYVGHPSDLLKVGEEVEAQVLEVDPRKKQIKLSIKALEREAAIETEPEAPLLTPMEIAFRQAQKRGRRAEKRAAERAALETSRDEQEEIFRRTIEQHVPKV